ncbi:MAG: ribosome biogenesis GTPase Der [Planctomycetes bacterium]|nr:ribosome biogenesis GTPase Der [Planctomycetota bacterium]
MKLPSVAIVGRPNVGKSSFLNAAAGQRISIVHDRPGVTRDRIATELTYGDRTFDLIDMGGIGIVDDQALDEDVEVQIDAAITGADVILFVVDSRDGVTPLDKEVAETIRRTTKPHLLVANKVDGERHRVQAQEFYRLGLGEPLMISAIAPLGITDVLDKLIELLPPKAEDEAPRRTGETLIALVGQRNAGKSTLLNAVAGEDRVIVSEIPGTTRDAVDVQVRFGERSFTLIDTAGLQRNARLDDSVEYYSQLRTHESIRRCDVVLHLIDATKEISQVDKKAAESVLDAFKPTIIVINKWDLVGDIDTEKYLKYISEKLPPLHFVPVIFISAKERLRLRQLVDLAFELHDQSRHRVPTSEVNQLVEDSASVRGPRVTRGKYPKIYYATQVGVTPPWIVLFVNDPTLFKDDFRRFLENRFREALPFREIPIRISFRKRQREK